MGRRLLLIDASIASYDKIVSAVAENVTPVIFDSAFDTYATLLDKIAAASRTGVTYSTVGLVQHGSATSSTYSIVRAEPSGELSEALGDAPSMESWQGIIGFFTTLKESYGVQIVDLISCLIYANPAWVAALNQLESRTGLNFRASRDATGNLANGGNWVMESDNVNIEGIYFTEAIREFTGLLFTAATFSKSSKYMVSATNKVSVPLVSASNPVDGMVKIIGSGSVVTWGNSNKGGSSASVSSSLASGIVAISSSDSAFAAIKADGSVVTWGAATHGGDSSAVSASLTSGVKAIAATSGQFGPTTGGAFAALKTDGSVVTWGYGPWGGDSSSVASSINSGVVAIASTKFAFAALKDNGSVITWGHGSFGGDSSSVSADIGSRVIALASTVFSFAALKDNGSVITWGNFVSSPAAVSSGVVTIAASDQAFAAIKSDGSAVAWGNASYGGDNSYLWEDLSSGVVAIASTERAFAALKSNGSVITWGDNRSGGDRNLYTSYYNSTSVANLLTSGVTSIASNFQAFTALKMDDSIVTWGSSTSAAPNVMGVKVIASGYSGFAAIKKDGGAVSWGDYVSDQITGVAAQVSSDVTQIVGSYMGFAAIKKDGSVVSWGYSSSGIITGATAISVNEGAFAAIVSSNTITATTETPAFNSSFTLSIASPNPSATYQWFRNGSPITGETGSSLTVLAARNLEHGGVYYLRESVSGVTGDSNTVLINVQPPSNPVISAQPGNTVFTGVSLTLSVSSPIAGASYEWYKNSSVVEGQASSSYTISDVALVNAGSYNVKLIVDGFSVSSNSINIAVKSAPVITKQPSGDIVAGTPFTLTISSPTVGATYQWYKNNVAITNETGNTYTVSNNTVASSGDVYKVKMTLEGSEVDSNSITITVVEPPSPVIEASTVSPVNAATFVLSVNSPIAEATYQWYKDSTIMSGVTGTTYTVTNAIHSAHSGAYKVRLSLGGYERDSNNITVTVGAPVISATTTTPAYASAFTLSLASSHPTATYQWYKDGAAISGATASSYYVEKATRLDHPGNYTVRQIVDSYTDDSNSVSIAVGLPPAPTLRATPGYPFPPAYLGTLALDVDNETITVYRPYPEEWSPLKAFQVNTLVGAASYEWFKDGVSLGAPAQSIYFSKNNVTSLNDAGVYTVKRIIDGETILSSNSVTVTVQDPTGLGYLNASYIASNNMEYTFVTGSRLPVKYGNSVRIYVTGSSYPQAPVQWYKDNTLISDASGFEYNIASATAVHEGTYMAKIFVDGKWLSITTTVIGGIGTLEVAAPPAPVIATTATNPAFGSSFTVSVTSPFLSTVQYKLYRTLSPYTYEVKDLTSADSTYTVASATYSTDHAGTYFVEAVDPVNLTKKSTSNSVTVTLGEPNQPLLSVTNATPLYNSNITFSVSAMGLISYKLFKDGLEIVDGYYLYYNVKPAESNGVYYAEAIIDNKTYRSNTITINVTFAPRITGTALDISSVSIRARQGNGFNLSATTNINVSPYYTITGYQWYKDGTPIVGETSTSYSVAESSDINAGIYSLQATAVSSATSTTYTSFSNPVRVLVVTPPVIRTQPVGGIVYSDGVSYISPTLALSVVADSSGAPVTYEWYNSLYPDTPVANIVLVNGRPTVSYKNPTYTIDDPTVGTFTYWVKVINLAGSTQSNSVTVTVNPLAPPVITQQPDISGSVFYNQYTNTTLTTYMLSVVADSSGGLPMTYAWYKGRNIIPGATSPSYNVSNISSTSFYSVVVTNQVGSVKSRSSLIRVESPSTVDGSVPSARVYPPSLTITKQEADCRLTIDYEHENPTYDLSYIRVTLTENTPFSLVLSDPATGYPAEGATPTTFGNHTYTKTFWPSDLSFNAGEGIGEVPYIFGTMVLDEFIFNCTYNMELSSMFNDKTAIGVTRQVANTDTSYVQLEQTTPPIVTPMLISSGASDTPQLKLVLRQNLVQKIRGEWDFKNFQILQIFLWNKGPSGGEPRTINITDLSQNAAGYLTGQVNVGSPFFTMDISHDMWATVWNRDGTSSSTPVVTINSKTLPKDPNTLILETYDFLVKDYLTATSIPGTDVSGQISYVTPSIPLFGTQEPATFNRHYYFKASKAYVQSLDEISYRKWAMIEYIKAHHGGFGVADELVTYSMINTKLLAVIASDTSNTLEYILEGVNIQRGFIKRNVSHAEGGALPIVYPEVYYPMYADNRTIGYELNALGFLYRWMLWMAADEAFLGVDSTEIVGLIENIYTYKGYVEGENTIVKFNNTVDADTRPTGVKLLTLEKDDRCIYAGQFRDSSTKKVHKYVRLSRAWNTNNFYSQMERIDAVAFNAATTVTMRSYENSQLLYTHFQTTTAGNIELDTDHFPYIIYRRAPPDRPTEYYSEYLYLIGHALMPGAPNFKKDNYKIYDSCGNHVLSLGRDAIYDLNGAMVMVSDAYDDNWMGDNINKTNKLIGTRFSNSDSLYTYNPGGVFDYYYASPKSLPLFDYDISNGVFTTLFNTSIYNREVFPGRSYLNVPLGTKYYIRLNEEVHSTPVSVGPAYDVAKKWSYTPIPLPSADSYKNIYASDSNNHTMTISGDEIWDKDKTTKLYNINYFTGTVYADDKVPVFMYRIKYARFDPITYIAEDSVTEYESYTWVHPYWIGGSNTVSDGIVVITTPYRNPITLEVQIIRKFRYRRPNIPGSLEAMPYTENTKYYDAKGNEIVGFTFEKLYERKAQYKLNVPLYDAWYVSYIPPNYFRNSYIKEVTVSWRDLMGDHADIGPNEQLADAIYIGADAFPPTCRIRIPIPYLENAVTVITAEHTPGGTATEFFNAYYPSPNTFTIEEPEWPKTFRSSVAVVPMDFFTRSDMTYVNMRADHQLLRIPVGSLPEGCIMLRDYRNYRVLPGSAANATRSGTEIARYTGISKELVVYSGIVYTDYNTTGLTASNFFWVVDSTYRNLQMPAVKISSPLYWAINMTDMTIQNMPFYADVNMAYFLDGKIYYSGITYKRATASDTIVTYDRIPAMTDADRLTGTVYILHTHYEDGEQIKNFPANIFGTYTGITKFVLPTLLLVYNESLVDKQQYECGQVFWRHERALGYPIYESRLTNLIVCLPYVQFYDDMFAGDTTLQTVSNGRRDQSPIKFVGKRAFKGATDLSGFSFAVHTVDEEGFANTPLLENILVKNGIRLELNAFNNSGLRNITIEDSSGLTINANTFNNTARLERVTIRNGCKEIKANAFTTSGVRHLTMENSPDLLVGTNSFISAPSLTSITSTNNGCKEIGPFSFANTPVSTITIDRTDDLIVGESAFENTPNVGDVTIYRGIRDLGARAFKGSGINNFKVDMIWEERYGAVRNAAVIKNAAQFSIKDETFINTPYLNVVSLQYGLNSIGSRAFYNSGVTRVTIAECPTLTIGEEAFSQTPRLNTIGVYGLTTIGRRAFYNSAISVMNLVMDLSSSYTAMSKVYPDPINNIIIGEEAFRDTPNLTELRIWNQYSNYIARRQMFRSIGDRAFYNSGIKSFVLTNEALPVEPALAWLAREERRSLVTGPLSFGSQAFYNSGIREFRVDTTGPLSFGSQTFYNSDLIEFRVDASANVTLSHDMFENCSSLVSIKISGVENNSFEPPAFSDLTSLKSLEMIFTSTANAVIGKLNAPNLETVVLRGGISALHPEIFNGCNKLKSVIIEGNMPYMWPLSIVGAQNTLEYLYLKSTNFTSLLPQFKDYVKLREVYVYGGPVLTIHPQVFSNCPLLETLYIDSNIGTSLVNQDGAGGWAFKSCNALKSLVLTFASNTNYVMNVPLSGLTELETCRIKGNVAVRNTNWQSGIAALSAYDPILQGSGKLKYLEINGKLETKLPTSMPTSIIELILNFNSYGTLYHEIPNFFCMECTSLTLVRLYGTLSKIGIGAFFKCTALTSLTLNDSLKEIEDLAFAFTGLSGELMIPMSVEKFGDSYFLGTVLRSVKYDGPVIDFVNPFKLVGGVWDGIGKASGNIEITISGPTDYVAQRTSTNSLTITDLCSNSVVTYPNSDLVRMLNKDQYELRIEGFKELLRVLRLINQNYSGLRAYNVAPERVLPLQISISLINGFVPGSGGYTDGFGIRYSSVVSSGYMKTADISSAAQDDLEDIMKYILIDAENAVKVYEKLVLYYDIPIPDEPGDKSIYTRLSEHLSTYTIIPQVLISHIQPAIQKILLANNNLFEPGANMIAAYGKKPMPQKFKFTTSNNNIFELFMDEFNTVTLRTDNNGDILAVAPELDPTDMIDDNDLLLEDLSYFTTEGEITFNLTKLLGDKYARALQYSYATASPDVSSNTFVNFTFCGAITTIADLQAIKNSIITIHSPVINITEGSMSYIVNSLVEITNVFSLRINDYSFCKSDYMTLKIKSNNDIICGINIFMDSKDITVNSTHALVNRPRVYMYNSNTTHALKDIPSIIASATAGEVDLSDIRGLRIETCIDSPTSQYLKPIPVIKFRTFMNLEDVSIVLPPDDWFWCYRLDGFWEATDTWFNKFFVINGLSYPNNYEYRPDFRGGSNRFVYTATPDTKPYFNGLQVEEEIGLKHSFAPDNFDYMGIRFKRRIPVFPTPEYTRSIASLQALTAANSQNVYLWALYSGDPEAQRQKDSEKRAVIIEIVVTIITMILPYIGQAFKFIRTLGGVARIGSKLQRGIGFIKRGRLIADKIDDVVVQGTRFGRAKNFPTRVVTKPINIPPRPTVPGRIVPNPRALSIKNIDDIPKIISEVNPTRVGPQSSRNIFKMPDFNPKFIRKAPARPPAPPGTPTPPLPKGPKGLAVGKGNIPVTQKVTETVRLRKAPGTINTGATTTPSFTATNGTQTTMVSPAPRGGISPATNVPVPRRGLRTVGNDPIIDNLYTNLGSLLNTHFSSSLSTTSYMKQFKRRRDFMTAFQTQLINSSQNPYATGDALARAGFMFSPYGDTLDSSITYLGATDLSQELITALNANIHEYAFYHTLMMQPEIIANDMEGLRVELQNDLTEAASIASLINDPLYVSPSPFIDLSRNSAYEAYRIQFYLPSYCNKQPSEITLDSLGRANAVPEIANPLMVYGDYLWKDIYLGDKRTPANAEVGGGVMDTTPRIMINRHNDEMYLGTRNVQYDMEFTELPNLVYLNVTNLTIAYPDTVTTIPTYAFCGSDGTDGMLPFNTRLLMLPYNPSGTLTIGNRAFYRSNLDVVVLPPNLVSIASEAFRNSGLTNVTFATDLAEEITLSNLTFCISNTSRAWGFNNDVVITNVAYLTFTRVNGTTATYNNLPYINIKNAPANMTITNTPLIRAKGTNYSTTIVHELKNTGTLWTITTMSMVVTNATGFQVFGNEYGIQISHGASVVPATSGVGRIERWVNGVFTNIEYSNPTYRPANFETLETTINSSTTVTFNAVVPTVFIGAASGARGVRGSRSMRSTGILIGENAFADNNLQVITLPPLIESIGANAFQNNPIQEIALTGPPPPIENIDITFFQQIPPNTAISVPPEYGQQVINLFVQAQELAVDLNINLDVLSTITVRPDSNNIPTFPSVGTGYFVAQNATIVYTSQSVRALSAGTAPALQNRYASWLPLGVTTPGMAFRRTGRTEGIYALVPRPNNPAKTYPVLRYVFQQVQLAGGTGSEGITGTAGGEDPYNTGWMCTYSSDSNFPLL